MRTQMIRTALALCLIALASLAMPHAARAWWHGGPRWYGGVYVAPPIYVAPPVYVAPPPYSPYYAPPVPAYSAPPVAAGSCSAGPYVCPLAGPAYAGQSCACDTPQGRFWGQTR